MSKTPSTQAHHYIPQFYLKRWCRDGKLTAYHRTRSGIRYKAYVPKSVAYVPNLYTLQKAGVANPQIMETDFFGFIDDKAAKIISALLRDDHSGQITPSERERLAIFVLSLAARIPAAIKKGEEIAQETNKRIARETGRLADLSEVRDRARQAIMEVIADRERLDLLLGMNWQIVDSSESPVDLVLGDQPLIRDRAITEDDCTLFLPLSPTQLLAMASPRLGIDFTHKDGAQLIEAMNNDSAQRSARFIYATGGHHVELADKFLP